MSGHLTIEMISKCFHLPICAAAKELEVCATILKKFCRSNGISRWPHRKFKSLQNMINAAQQQLRKTTDENEIQKLQSEIQAFEAKKQYLTQNPNISFQEIVSKNVLQSFSKAKLRSQISEYEEEACELLVNLSTDNYSAILAPYVIQKSLDSENSEEENPDAPSFYTHTSRVPLKKAILKVEREKQQKTNGCDQLFNLSTPQKLSIYHLIDASQFPSTDSSSNKRKFSEISDGDEEYNPQALKLQKYWV